MKRKDTLPELVFATQNPNKVQEIREALKGKLNVKGLEAFSLESEIPETGNTLEENALQKARFIASRFGVDCFSDDTGLEVAVLGGAPGVFSARYAGEEKSASANIQKLLSEMQGKKDRNACFRTVIALVFRGKEYLFEGNIEGVITENIQGSKGFGYDPVFRPTGSDHTFAEMEIQEKNALSHRARAVNKLVDFLSKTTLSLLSIPVILMGAI